MIPRTPQVMPQADQSLLQYKSVTLEPNSRHEVYVSYITDGPSHFSVQLKKSESILAQLMREINSIPLKPFEELPIPGTVCLAKCVEDSHICRAVITSEVDNQYKLFYVDFGNTEIVPPDNLYQMPFKYIIPKIMAIRLSLDGIDKSTVTLEMQCAFKQFVDNRLLMMEVFPSAKKMALPKCRMWDPATNIDVMEILNKAAQLAFPNAIPLHRGFTRAVKVTFVYSCNKFYIHLKSNEDELSQLMANIQVYCNSTTSSFLEDPKVGQPCCAQFRHDGQWYRSSIVELNGNLTKVKYIDYGNEDDVTMESLKPIQGEFLTCMRPQAIECCLNGYQNMTEDLERDNKLEELILDQEFTMKVIDIINGRSLVDLIDSQGRSVTALLMEAMITQPKVQVVANGNLENNQTKYGSGNYNRRNDKEHSQERWTSRDKSQNRKEKNEDWRQGPRNQVNSWNSPEKDNLNSYSNSNNHSDWNGKDGGNNRNRSFRQDNEGFGNKEIRNKPKNDNWTADNSTRTWGENEEFQGVKKRTKNFSTNNGNNRNRDRTDNEEWGNKKKSYNGNDFSEIKSYKGKNSYDSDSSSYKMGRSSERSFDGKPRYDRGDNKKKSFRRDSNNHINDNEQTDGRKFNSRNNSNWNDRHSNNMTQANSFNNANNPIDPAPDNTQFQTLEVSGQKKVTLSWFHNPCSFFCQLMDTHMQFNSLMDEIQELYKDKPASFAVEGAPAIALFPEDNVFYRCRILKSAGNKYKVYYVDFGNISVVDSVWPIDKKFIEMPMQAIPCGLGGIGPVDENWPDPNAFVNYMQKDTLDCHFQCYQVDRYMVNLSSNDQDIKQLLVDNNLAKYVPISVPSIDFDINLLSGHTFRAMLESINDLSDFNMCLSSGVKLLCTAHNLSTASETFVDELKGKIGQVLVVYCDNVIGDRLEVTLYDHLGNKLVILNPDEGAFDTIESVCPYLLIQAKVEGFVSFVNDTSIVVQPTECTEQLQSLLNEIYEHYENLPQDTTIIPEEGSLYAVRCVEDSNWYRGRVMSFDDEKVNVLYVDYGNTEDVPFANVRELDEKFYWWDRMAILVHVNVPTAELFEKQIKAVVHYGEVGLEGEITHVEESFIPEEAQKLETADANPETEILEQTPEHLEGGENTNEVTGPLSTENEITQNEAQSFHEEVYANKEPIVEGTPVVISHIDGPSDFYIQLAESQNAIAELQSKIQEQIDEMPVLENTSIGGLCAAPYSVDQMWYRSQILDADEDITTVRFIDYGNTDVIDNKATQIKTLPAEFLALEEYARRCRLNIKPLEEEWSKPTTDRFEELAYAENVTVQFISQDEKANYVELFSDGQNVKDLLIAENLAVLEGGVIEAKLKGYISHMNSPSEFWVQLDGWCAELEWIAEQLSNASSFPDLEDFTPGSLCAAMFPDDEMWYRARILSSTVAGLEVLFLDYGNSCVCGNLKQLPEHLVMAPPLALKCSLQKPEGMFSWSPEAVQKFADLSADGQTEFTVKKLTTGETSTVELYMNDEEVSLKLLPITDDVYVADIKSMDDFAVSKDGSVSDERYRLEKIPGCDYNEECLSKFVEISNEGKTCYGIEYLSENTVRLYLNGNDIRKELLPILKNKSQNLEDSNEAEQPENLISETDQSCDNSQTNQIGEVALDESAHKISNNESPQTFESPQDNETLVESQEESSEICEKAGDKENNEEYSEILIENKLIEGASQLPTENENNEEKETPELCEQSSTEIKTNEETSEIIQFSDEKENTEVEEAFELCEQKQTECEINEEKVESDMSLTPTKNEKNEEQEVFELCEQIPTEKNNTELQESSEISASEDNKNMETQEENIEIEEASELCEQKPTECEINEEKADSDMSLTPTKNENNEEQEVFELCEQIPTEYYNTELQESPEISASEENKNNETQEDLEICKTPVGHENEDAVKRISETLEKVLIIEEDKEIFDGKKETRNVITIINETGDIEHQEIYDKNESTKEVLAETATGDNSSQEEVAPCGKDTSPEDQIVEKAEECDTLNSEANESKDNLESDNRGSPNYDTEEEIHIATTKTIDVEPSNEIPLTSESPLSVSEPKSGHVNVEDEKVCDTPQAEEDNALTQEVLKESSDVCDNVQTAAPSAGECDIPNHSLPINSSDKTEVPKSVKKLEFTEKILTSFSAPTVSEIESVPKISLTKVTPKVQGSEGAEADS